MSENNQSEIESHQQGDEMRVDPVRAEHLVASLSSIKARVQQASIGKSVSNTHSPMNRFSQCLTRSSIIRSAS